MSPILPFHGVQPVIAADAFIASTATLTGNVRIGAQSSVFFGAVLRGDSGEIRVGERTNLQDNVVVHADQFGPIANFGNDISIGHGAILHGCIIEDNCLIGMNVTILNNAKIGAGSLIAAGTLVLEGAQIPPGSLVAGVPGKVRRPLTDEEKEHLVANAQQYVQLGADYAAMNG